MRCVRADGAVARPSARGLTAQPLCEVDRHDREEDEEHGHHVDDRQRVRALDGGEHPQRHRVHAGPGGEVRDDHLVEAQRKRKQAAGEERRPHRGQEDVDERLPRVGAEVHRGLLERAGRAAEAGDHVVEATTTQKVA